MLSEFKAAPLCTVLTTAVNCPEISQAVHRLTGDNILYVPVLQHVHCSHFALDLLIACLPAAIMGRRSSAIASFSRDVKQPAPRSASNLKLRAAASRLKYNAGFTLPPHRRFLLDFGSEVSPEALSTASEKLTIMEDMGLQPVSVKVFSQGPSACATLRGTCVPAAH